MGCRKLNITDYYRLTDTTGTPYASIPDSTGTNKKSPRGFKPVVSVSTLNYRYYSPGLGRWLSRDPIGEYGGYNLYVMVGNDPIDLLDYFGLGRTVIVYTDRGLAEDDAVDKAQRAGRGDPNKDDEDVITSHSVEAFYSTMMALYKTCYDDAIACGASPDKAHNCCCVSKLVRDGHGQQWGGNETLNDLKDDTLSFRLNGKPAGQVIVTSKADKIRDLKSIMCSGATIEGQGCGDLGFDDLGRLLSQSGGTIEAYHGKTAGAYPEHKTHSSNEEERTLGPKKATISPNSTEEEARKQQAKALLERMKRTGAYTAPTQQEIRDALRRSRNRN